MEVVNQEETRRNWYKGWITRSLKQNIPMKPIQVPSTHF